MLNTNRTVALAGLFSGLALLGAGAAQAHGEQAPPTCAQTENGYVCSQKNDRRYVTEDGSKVHIQQSWTCRSAERSHNVGPRAEGERVHNASVTNCSPQVTP